MFRIFCDFYDIFRTLRSREGNFKIPFFMVFYLQPLTYLRHFVMTKNGKTMTMKIGMKAMITTMTQIRAMRAMMRAKGKRRQATAALQ